MSAPQVRRIALCLQYDGSAFHGWQRQHNAGSVQETLEGAIRRLDPAGSGQTMAAGRTDTGVHAAAQVVHFDCAGPIPTGTGLPCSPIERMGDAGRCQGRQTGR